MKLTQLLEALDKRGIGEAVLRGGEPMQTRVEGEWRAQGAATPVGALGAMLESGAPPEALAQWQADDRCQFEQNGFVIKAARQGDRVQIAVKRAMNSASPFTASTDGNATQTVLASAAAPAATKASLQAAVVEWYYLDEGAEKGPVAPDRMRVLIEMGTIGGDTLVWSDGMSDWLPARDSDLRAALPVAALSATAAPVADPTNIGAAPATGSRSNAPYTVQTSGEEVDLEERRNKGASWFYWIVGLTLINSIISLTGTDWSFSLGATITVVADYFARESGSSSARIIALLFDVIVIAFYAACGVFSHRGASWAFILGLVFFALDSILMLITLQPIGILIHGWALFSIFSGLLANNNLRRLQREKAVTGFSVAG